MAESHDSKEKAAQFQEVMGKIVYEKSSEALQQARLTAMLDRTITLLEAVAKAQTSQAETLSGLVAAHAELMVMMNAVHSNNVKKPSRVKAAVVAGAAAAAPAAAEPEEGNGGGGGGVAEPPVAVAAAAVAAAAPAAAAVPAKPAERFPASAKVWCKRQSQDDLVARFPWVATALAAAIAETPSGTEPKQWSKVIEALWKKPAIAEHKADIATAYKAARAAAQPVPQQLTPAA